MMKKINRTITNLIIAAAMIAMAACTNMLEPPRINRDKGTGTVYIAIDGNSAGDRAAARTLGPDPVHFTRYRASFSGPETCPDIDITGDTSVDLAPGNWTITVTASTGTAPSYNEAGRGSAAVEVLSGRTVDAEVIILPITGGGKKGDLRYSINIPSVDSAILSLTDMTTNAAVEGTPLDLNAIAVSGTVSGILNGLDAGYYLTNLRLEQGGKYAGRTEVIHIYDGLETAAEYDFTDNDFAAGAILTEGVWQDDVMVQGGSKYYQFSVTQGNAYAVYWNDKYGGLGKTLDIRVSASYESSGDSIFYRADDDGYDIPRTFTAESTGNVILMVESYFDFSTSRIGSYAVLYGEVTSLTNGTAAPGTISAGGIKLYSFPVNANTPYEVSWEDSGDQAGNSSYTGDITVTAYYSNIGWSNILFSATDDGYTAPPTVSDDGSSDTIYLKVEGISAGTYTIKYGPGTFPAVSLTDSVWQDGDMAVSGLEYYRFSVTQGNTYAVYSNDADVQQGKTMDISVSAFYESSGDSILDWEYHGNGYDRPQTFTAESTGNLILRVAPYFGSVGSYAVLYTEISPLTDGTAAPGTITAGGVKLYSFQADANMPYEVSWEDSGDQAGNSYSGDITVTAYSFSFGWSDILFNAADDGYTAPPAVSYGSSTTIYLKVEGISAGTYTIKYGPGTFPAVSLTESVWQDDVWQDGDTYEYYRFSVTQGNTYAVYWDDANAYQGKTMDIEVSAFYESSGNSIFSREDYGYPETFTAESTGNVILRVEPRSVWVTTGTYSVKYQQQ
jgi:hypothetical protein